tara:strand:- start:10787 stop:12781 length:1995 start_codon:yes stop_codon:yes gene_type:complete
MKTVALILLTAVTLSSCKDQAPDRLKELMKKDGSAPTYKAFSEITPVTPVPAKFNLSIGRLLVMALLKKQSMKYEIVPAGEYNDTEKKIMKFYHHPGLLKSLSLLSYARQIKANHPYRINPFVPFATRRSENSMIEQMGVGPAAVVSDLFQLKGQYQGVITYRDQGVDQKAEVSFSPKSLPMSGLMFLMDHQVFSLDELVNNPDLNVLQDVIIHEFTHIWNNEILDEETRNKQTIENNKTEVGHDTQIVSNSYLAFSEGLAESFEALYGTGASKIMNMTDREREVFFGNFTANISKSLEFLANRQTYVRRNSYVYNLYDFKDCTLRAVDAVDSSDAGPAKALERLLTEERFDADAAKKALAWLNFDDRFYGDGGRVSTTTLKKNCQVDSPLRLGAKEGFVATMMYNILYSGSLVDSAELEQEFAFKGQKGWKAFAAWNAGAENYQARSIASDERQARNEKIFLLGFRKLVEGIMNSKAGTLKELLAHMLSSDGNLDANQRVRLAYQIMKVSLGSLSSADQTLSTYFASPSTIRDNIKNIYAGLENLENEGRIDAVFSKLDALPPVYVSFKSQIDDGQKRLNINVAHHIDLIDMFGGNHHRVKQLAQRLDRGEGFESADDFVAFAATFDKEELARSMLEQADKEIGGLDQLEKKFRFKDLINHSL